MKSNLKIVLLAIGLLLIIVGIFFLIKIAAIWNNPHNMQSDNKIIYYASFNERPKTLDPARAYNTNEALFTAQIYEPPLQYDYFARPYRLIPLTAKKMPQILYLDKKGNELELNAKNKDIAFTVYRISIKPNIYYQPHPAFAKNKQGAYWYHQLTAKQLGNIYKLNDFFHEDSRELTAADYVYQIKRLASPKTQSPIYGLMSDYIVGLKKLSKQIQKQQQENPQKDFIDLRKLPFVGAKVIDRYTYEIIIKGQYPQFIYWLAMPFFSPIPWEADKFYSQKILQQRNINFDWYPIGTGPYRLTENNPNQRMVLSKNPNFRTIYFPKNHDGSATAKKLQDKRIPFIDHYVFSLEKESIPRWTKFLQGFYDQSAIGSDNFDQAIKISAHGEPLLTPLMATKNLQLRTSVTPGIFYLGFNMRDDVVGGQSLSAKKLRQAISIAINFEEFISIFLNGRGIVAHGPIPPELFGYHGGKKGINPVIFHWKNKRIERKSLAKAKQLLAAAGFPNGRNVKTGEPLVLYFDAVGGSSPDDMARFDWLRKQFTKLGIQLQVRATQYNRFQEKIRTGNAQLFMWGWQADYPDPENFLFLFYGPNSRVKFGGENASNYQNPRYDKLFKQMRILPNGAERQQVIDKMVAILQQDAPIVWGFHPKTFQLSHSWVLALKENAMANNHLKYKFLNPDVRKAKQELWNKPIVWPVILIFLLLIIILLPFVVAYKRKKHLPVKMK